MSVTPVASSASCVGAAGGDQQLVGAQFAVRRGEHEFAVPFTIDIMTRAGPVCSSPRCLHANAAVTVSAYSWVFVKNQRAASQIVTCPAANACASSSATITDEPNHGQCLGIVSLTSASVEVQYGVSFQAGESAARPGSRRGDQAWSNATTRSPPSLSCNDQVAIVLKAGGAVQHSDRFIAQDAFVLARSLPCAHSQQRRALDGRR